MTQSRPARALALAVSLASAAVVLAPRVARAGQLTITSAGIARDLQPGDGVCATGGFVPLNGVPVPECTLPAAVDEANAVPGPDVIVFHPQIARNDPAAVRIRLASPLVLTDRVLLVGESAPGHDPGDPDGVPAAVALDGSTAASGDGVVVAAGAGGSVISALAVHGFPGSGLRIEADDVTVQGCAVGLRADGSLDGNGKHGIEVVPGADRATIGRSFDPALGFVGSGNVVAANGRDGISVAGDDARLAGNLVGTDPSGAAVEIDGAPTGNQHGIFVSGQRVLVGWSAVDHLGQRRVAGNLVSGNAWAGVRATDGSLVIEGNRIGTDASGGTALANLGAGISIFGGHVEVRDNLVSGNAGDGIVHTFGGALTVHDNRIGVTLEEDAALANGGRGIAADETVDVSLRGNVIAGNAEQGVVLGGRGGELLGNWIGTTPAGLALGNGLAGVQIEGLAQGVTRIGGRTPGAGNVIGDNGGPGIEILGSAGTSVIEGNWIGTNAEGAPLGNAGHGIVLTSSHTVGGAEPGAANVIGHNAGDGIRIVGNGNQIVGNFIGTDATGRDLGNGDDGIELASHRLTLASSRRNVIGSGTTTPADEVAGRGNTIAFNGNRGVELGEDNFQAPYGGVRENAIRGNSIHDNGALGIDLHPFGPTPNDHSDPDTGTNFLMNHPVLDPAGTSFHGAGRRLKVRYVLAVHPTVATYPLTVDFYLADAGGEGRVYLGSDTYTTADAYRYREAEIVVPAGIFVGTGPLVATATDGSPHGSTSEFGAPVPIEFHPGPSCGLGAEPAFLLPALSALQRSVRRRRGRGRGSRLRPAG